MPVFCYSKENTGQGCHYPPSNVLNFPHNSTLSHSLWLYCLPISPVLIAFNGSYLPHWKAAPFELLPIAQMSNHEPLIQRLNIHPKSSIKNRSSPLRLDCASCVRWKSKSQNHWVNNEKLFPKLNSNRVINRQRGELVPSSGPPCV